MSNFFNINLQLSLGSETGWGSGAVRLCIQHDATKQEIPIDVIKNSSMLPEEYPVCLLGNGNDCNEKILIYSI